MAKLDRVTAKVFASSAAATEIGQFGSAVAGSKLETADVATIQGLSAWLDGWSEALVSGNRYPALQEMNGLLKVLSYQGAYALQEGIAEYDSATTYYIGSIVKKTGTFELYGSLTDDNVGNALTVGTEWKFLVDLANINATATVAAELCNIIKSCKLDNNGDCDLLSYSGSDVTVQSTSDNPLIFINPNGTTSTIASQNSLDFSSGYANGKYSLIQLADGTVDTGINYAESKTEPIIELIPTLTSATSDFGIVTSEGSAIYDEGFEAFRLWGKNNTGAGISFTQTGSKTANILLTPASLLPANGEVFFKLSGNAPYTTVTNYSIVVTYEDDTTETVHTVDNLTTLFQSTGSVELTNGKKIKIIQLNCNANVQIANTGTTNNIIWYESSKIDGNYWLNTSVIPNTLQKYEVSEWIEKQGVYIGSVNVASNLVASVEQPVIRPNNGVGHTVIETYVNGVSGYRIWSDGYCEQWGRAITGMSGWIDIIYLKEYKNVDYNIEITAYHTDGTSINFYTGVSFLLRTGVRLTSSLNAVCGIGWKVSGYLA